MTYMRKLNNKQQVLLRNYLINDNTVCCVNDIDEKTLSYIEKLNDHETLWQNINRFISDFRLSQPRKYE